MEKENMYCGVDLHHGKSSFCFVDEQGDMKRQIEVNTEKKIIEDLLGSCEDFKVNYAFEAGGMARYFYRIVKGRENTGKIHVVHPYKFKIISESKNKNDKEDSKKLAKALQKDYLPNPVHIKSDKSRQLQIYLGIRKRRISVRTKIINQTKSITRGLGIKVAVKNLKSSRSFNNMITSLNEYPFEQGIIKELFAEFQIEAKKIEEVELKIKNSLEQCFGKDYGLLITIPGIGFVASATILSVIDDIERFNTAGEYSSYCGLVPSEHSSGNKILHGRITKEGPKSLRTVYIQAAWSIVRNRHNKEDIRLNKLRKKFYRISVKEKNAQRAVVAVARHLSRITFGVLKHQKKYSRFIKENKTQAC